MRDQEIRGRLVHALREAGVTKNPQGLADAICAAINCKVAKSEGKHHAKFHKTPKPLEMTGLDPKALGQVAMPVDWGAPLPGIR